MTINKIRVGSFEIISLCDGIVESDLASFYPNVPLAYVNLLKTGTT